MPASIPDRAVLLTAAVLWFARQASNLLRYLILAQLLAFALEPAVTWLHQRQGRGRGAATGLLLADAARAAAAGAVGLEHRHREDRRPPGKR